MAQMLSALGSLAGMPMQQFMALQHMATTHPQFAQLLILQQLINPAAQLGSVPQPLQLTGLSPAALAGMGLGPGTASSAGGWLDPLCVGCDVRAVRVRVRAGQRSGGVKGCV